MIRKYHLISNQHNEPKLTFTGEISALNNLTQTLTSPDGAYKYSPLQAASAFKDLTLYTNAEPCPMCASAIRWAGFKECVFGTSIQTLIEKGWSQIDISAEEVFERSEGLAGGETRLLGGVLREETDGYFGWQFDEGAVCPSDCERVSGGGCRPVE